MREHIRTWTDPDGVGFRLELYDLNETDFEGHHRLGYEFHHGHKLIFQGEDFACSPCQAVDSDQCVASLLGWLSLKRGDVDRDYFNSYTTEQLEWRDEWAETLSIYALELAETAKLAGD